MFLFVFLSNLSKCFTTPELGRWPGIVTLYGAHLRATKVFGPDGTIGVAGDIEDEEKGAGDKRWEVLHDRVVEHVRIFERSLVILFTNFTIV